MNRGLTGGVALCDRAPAIRQAVLHLIDRVRLSSIFVLDERGNRVSFLLEKLKYLFDGRVALAERLVRSVILLAIFQM